MSGLLNKIREFIEESIGELRKCTWPSYDELFESTILVIVSVVLLAGFVYLVDFLSRWFIQALTM